MIGLGIHGIASGNVIRIQRARRGSRLESFDDELLVDRAALITGNQSEATALEATHTSAIRIPTRLPFQTLLEPVPASTARDASEDTIRATLFFRFPLLGVIRGPITQRGKLPIVHLPRIQNFDLKKEG